MDSLFIGWLICIGRKINLWIKVAFYCVQYNYFDQEIASKMTLGAKIGCIMRDFCKKVRVDFN